MRKHSPRKWLHAILDLLPVILIPVFMIYSHRHTLTERTEVDIQYKYESNEVNNNSDLIIGNVYNFNLPNNYNNYIDLSFIVKSGNFYIDFESITSDDSSYYFRPNNQIIHITLSNETFLVETYYDINETYLTFEDVSNVECNNLVLQLINYAPTQNIYTCFSYTIYNEIESVEVQDSNDNIMSVFAKDLSNTVDNYFNMNEVFNLGDVWTWINTNIFSGTAPLIAKTIWNIIVYEFVIDLLFVFYSFFMFLIDFVDNLLEKPFNKGR